MATETLRPNAAGDETALSPYPSMGEEQQLQYSYNFDLKTYARMGQRLTISNRTVKTLTFHLYPYGSPTGTVTFRIWKIDDTVINEKSFDASTVVTDNWYTVTFDTPQNINEEVRIFATYTGGDANNHIGIASSVGDYKPFECLTGAYTTSWVENTGYDIAYKYTYTGGTTSYNWQDVDDVTPDEESTYVFPAVDGVYHRDLYNLPAHTGTGTITSIDVYFRVYGTGATAKPAIKSDSTVTYGTEVTPTTTWTTHSQNWVTNPADGQTWEWSDIDSLQIGIGLQASGKGYAECTQVYVVVNYTVAGAVELGAFCQQLSPLGFNMYSAGQVRGG